MFSGFPPEALTFFRGLKRNNTREWFQPRKETYETQVRAPMAELVELLNEELREFAPEHTNDPKKAIYRIYRDTRFSSDKTPYKTHIAALFPRRGHEKHGSAGYYCALSLEGIEVAGGLYMPGPQELLAVRNWLARHHSEFSTAAKSMSRMMGGIQGESLRRVPKGFEASHPAVDLLKKKQWFWYVTLDVDLATSPKIFGEIVKRFRAMTPAIEMLNQPLKEARAKAAREEKLLAL